MALWPIKTTIIKTGKTKMVPRFLKKEINDFPRQVKGITVNLDTSLNNL